MCKYCRLKRNSLKIEGNSLNPFVLTPQVKGFIDLELNQQKLYKPKYYYGAL